MIRNSNLHLAIQFNYSLKFRAMLFAAFVTVLLLISAIWMNQRISEQVRPRVLKKASAIEFVPTKKAKVKERQKSKKDLIPFVNSQQSQKYLSLSSQIEKSPEASFDIGPDYLVADDFISAGNLSIFENLVDRAPKLIENQPIRYPRLAKKAKIEGFVEFRLWINAQGVVERVNIIKSEPVGVFDDAVIKAARNYRFRPAILDARAVAVTARQKVEFNLK